MTHSAKKFSKNIGHHRKSTETSGLLPTPNSQDMNTQALKGWRDRKRGVGSVQEAMNKFTSSQAVSPANPSLKLDEEKERQMTASSGQRCLGLFESFGHGGSLVKMLRDSLLSSKAWYSNKCVLTWKRKDTKFGRLLFQLAPLMRHTEGIESGLSPTPQASDATTGSIMGENDTFYQTKGLPRKVNKNGKDGSVGLGRLVQMLPTPSAQERGAHTGENAGSVGWKSRMSEKGVKFGATLQTVIDSSGKKIGTQLRLEPALVEWMMGFPEGWTEIPDSKLLEMRLSRKSQKKL
jgi:hypothetical protein